MSELAEPLAPKARESRTDAGLPPWTDRAVLLYGPRKSGTSLLLNLLDGGEEIVAFPREMKLKFFLTAVWPGGQGAEVYSRLSRHAGQEFKGFSAERYRQLSEETAGRARSLREQMQIDVHNLHQSADWKPAAPRAPKCAPGRPSSACPPSCSPPRARRPRSSAKRRTGPTN